MTDHTPGPWKWDDYELRSVSSGEVVLSRYIPLMYSEPNASLIAAAPDLLKALAYVFWYFHQEELPADDWEPIVAVAIAKATAPP